jgi:putative hemolysin
LEPPQFTAIFFSLFSVLTLLLIASYEATFTVLSRSTLEKLVENGVQRASLMLRIYEPRHRLRLIVRLGAALGVIGISFSLLFFIRSLLPAPRYPAYYSIAISILSSLFLCLPLYAPRRLRFEEEGEAPHIPALALAFVPLHILLSPFIHILDRFTAGDYTDEDFRAAKEEELRSFVESESESGVIEEGEREMIQGVFGFHDRIVREVMLPRVDIEAIEMSATLADLLRLIRETGHSRLPLYEETLDQIRGLIYAKDLLQLLVGRDDLDLAMPIATFMEQLQDSPDNQVPFTHDAYYVPETKKVDDLLHDLRIKKLRMAIVIDEYSGTAGLISTEDLVEEIVGDIQDEYDDEEEMFHWVEPDVVMIANARIDIDDLNEVMEVDLPNEGFETLGGFIYDHLGSIPEEEQVVQTNDLELKILKVDGQRIEKVQIKRLPPPQEEKEEKNGA